MSNQTIEEMLKIWPATWTYSGTESLVPNPKTGILTSVVLTKTGLFLTSEDQGREFHAVVLTSDENLRNQVFSILSSVTGKTLQQVRDYKL